jgi:hypothetical protein
MACYDCAPLKGSKCEDHSYRCWIELKHGLSSLIETGDNIKVNWGNCVCGAIPYPRGPCSTMQALWSEPVVYLVAIGS